jgi:hypothetical protein
MTEHQEWIVAWFTAGGLLLMIYVIIKGLYKLFKNKKK